MVNTNTKLLNKTNTKTSQYKEQKTSIEFPFNFSKRRGKSSWFHKLGPATRSEWLSIVESIVLDNQMRSKNRWQLATRLNLGYMHQIIRKYDSKILLEIK